MNLIRTGCFILIFMLSSLTLTISAGTSEPAPLLPESLAARNSMAADQKTTTVFILEKEPVKATKALNTSNDEYAKKGWSVFSILPYVNDGDFLGFFITYQKKLILQ